ncbi:MAG: rhomboid family intramembrane serine protease [Planctomycetia bacterium]|nr:rhomboid family intramembrane serine protease [Planctomycetia bacterium]
MDAAPPPPDGPTELVPRRRDERRAIPVDMDAHQAWATGLFRHVRRTLLGPLFVAINVAVFVVMVATGVDARAPSTPDLVRWGANHWTLSLADEPWRLLTSGFLHIGLVHLAVNCYALIQLRFVEQVLGRSGWLVTYLGAIVAGSLLSVARHGGAPSAGASGGIFGLLGAVLAVSVAPRAQTGIPDELRIALRNGMVQTAVLNAFVALSVPHIDHWAHGGGLLAGFCIAIAIVRPPDDEHARGRLRRAAVAAAVTLAALGGVFELVRPRGPKLERLRATEQLVTAAADLNDARALVLGVVDELQAPPLRADAEARLDEAGRAIARARAVHARYARAVGLAATAPPTPETGRFVDALEETLRRTRDAVAARRALDALGDRSDRAEDPTPAPK